MAFTVETDRGTEEAAMNYLSTLSMGDHMCVGRCSIPSGTLQYLHLNKWV